MVSINREISATRLPPQRIREMNITNIRDSRHIVRDPGVSAFTPGARTRDLPVRQVEGARRGGPGVGGPKEGVKVDRGPGVGRPKEGAKIDRGPGGGGKKEGAKIDRGPGVGGKKEGVKTGGPGGSGGPEPKTGPMEKPK